VLGCGVVGCCGLGWLVVSMLLVVGFVGVTGGMPSLPYRYVCNMMLAHFHSFGLVTLCGFIGHLEWLVTLGGWLLTECVEAYYTTSGPRL
jgi:hypothetical protein